MSPFLVNEDEAKAILNRWDQRRPGEQALVLQADRLLAQLWERKQQLKRRAQRKTKWPKKSK